jgi:hypothetical protein
MSNSRTAEARDPEGASPDAGAAETRHAERTGARETSAARGKGPTAVAAKAPTMPPAASACVGFKRQKRDYEEQRGDSANADHRPPAPDA